MLSPIPVLGLSEKPDTWPSHALLHLCAALIIFCFLSVHQLACQFCIMLKLYAPLSAFQRHTKIITHIIATLSC